MTVVSDTTTDNFQEFDISDEKWREYTYPGGEKLVIHGPERLAMRPCSDGTVTQRIVCKDGSCVYPAKGWLGIRWMNKEGAPRFNF